MKTIALVVVALVALASCGGIAIEEPSSTSSDGGSQAFATPTSYPAHNGFASPQPPTPATHFCHPIYLFGSGAHNAAPVYQGFAVPKWGGAVIHSVTSPQQTISAFPNDVTRQTQNAVMEASYECHALTDFGGSGWMGQMGADLNWAPETTLRLVTGQTPLWGYNSACWLDKVGDLSAWGELAALNLYSLPSDPTGLGWRVDASGFPALLVGGRCAYFGKTLSVATWHHAEVGAPSQESWVTYATGTCFIYRVKGNLDNGSVTFRHDLPGGAWRLDVTGDLQEAEGYCVTYQ